jgi:hypothetical protein
MHAISKVAFELEKIKYGPTASKNIRISREYLALLLMICTMDSGMDSTR